MSAVRRHGPGWVAIGDAAGFVNPMNGEGIDYGLESGMLAVDSSSPTRPRRRQRTTAMVGERFDAFLRTGRRFSFLIGHPWLLRAGLRIAVGTQAAADITLAVMGNLVDNETPGAAGRVLRLADRVLGGPTRCCGAPAPPLTPRAERVPDWLRGCWQRPPGSSSTTAHATTPTRVLAADRQQYGRHPASAASPVVRRRRVAVGARLPTEHLWPGASRARGSPRADRFVAADGSRSCVAEWFSYGHGINFQPVCSFPEPGHLLRRAEAPS